MVYKYDKESDVLSISLAKRPFDYAEEVGDFIVHFDKHDKPVYIEILNAHQFIARATTLFPKSSREDILHTIRTA